MTRTIDIPFDNGQNEGADRVALQPTELRSLQNARLARDGRIEVRPQYTALAATSHTSSSTPVTMFDLTTFRDRLIGFGSYQGGAAPTYPREIFAYVNTALGAWKGVADAVADEPSNVPVVQNVTTFFQGPYGRTLFNTDLAYTNGYLCAVACDTTSAVAVGKLFLFDATTGVLLKTAAYTSTRSLRVVASGTNFIVLQRTSAGSIVAQTLSTTAFTLSSGSTLVTTELTDTNTWDASPLVGSTDFLLTYSRPGSTNTRIRRYTAAFSATWTTDIAAANGHPAVIGNTTAVLHALNVSGAVSIRTLDPSTGSVTVGPTSLAGTLGSIQGAPSLCFVDTGYFVVGGSVTAGSTNADFGWAADYRTIDGSHTLVVSNGGATNVHVASKLVQRQLFTGAANAAYGVGATIVNAPDATLGLSAFYATTVLDAMAPTLATALGHHAVLNYGVSSALDNAAGTLHGRSSVATDGAGRYWAACDVLDGAALGVGGSLGTFQIFSWTRGTEQRHQTAELGGDLFIAGGYLALYDGFNAVEAGFFDSPVIDDITQSSGGNLTLLGTYRYVAVYEWQDATGRNHRSPPSPAFAVTLTGSNAQTSISVTSAKSRRRRDPNASDASVKTVIYRANPNDSVFFRVAEGTAISGTTGYAAMLSVADNVSNTTAESRPILYTQSQKPLPDNHAQPCKFVAAGQDRLIVGGLPDPYQVAFSQRTSPGEPLAFAHPSNFAFTLSLPEPVTAVETTGDQYIAFTASGIYAFAGGGPQRNGQGEFFAPQTLYADGGCIDWRSVVSCSAGTFFQMAADKLCVLGPQGVQWIGQPVRDTLATYPVITGAALCESTQQVVFSCTNTAGDAGVLLIYDLRRGAWSVDTVGPVTALTAYQGRIAYVLAGVVYLEDEAIAQGVGALPTLSARTGSLSPFGMNGWGTLASVSLLGTYVGDSTVEAFISYDDGKTWTSLGTVAATTANTELGNQVSGSALSSGDPIALKWFPQLQNVARFALRFDLTHATNTGGMRLHAASIEVEGMAGTTRLAAGATR